EEMDQIQRWTYDYVSKFSKIDSKDAKDMKKQLMKDCELTEEESVEIVNIRPTSLAELRSFTFGWKKLILAETLAKMLKIIKEHS
ncbi:MAG: RNA polymerase Rpb4, partial [Nitrosarchaeum sp.]|nr:RNA polymerase Rpb4 [Nitrosarchaeum sp.]